MQVVFVSKNGRVDTSISLVLLRELGSTLVEEIGDQLQLLLYKTLDQGIRWCHRYAKKFKQRSKQQLYK
jgi:hypothetical protein